MQTSEIKIGRQTIFAIITFRRILQTEYTSCLDLDV